MSSSRISPGCWEAPGRKRKTRKGVRRICGGAVDASPGDPSCRGAATRPGGIRCPAPWRTANSNQMHSKHKESDMRLSPARVEQTLAQFEAHVLPDDHPAMQRIRGLWGDHTYFLAPNGLNIVEPIDGGDAGI